MNLEEIMLWWLNYIGVKDYELRIYWEKLIGWLMGNFESVTICLPKLHAALKKNYQHNKKTTYIRIFLWTMNKCKSKIKKKLIQLYHPKSKGFDFGFFEKVEKQCWSRIRIGLVHYITNKN